jgi:hypothetical protein
VTLAALPPELALAFESRFGAAPGGRGANVEFRVAEKHASDMIRAALDAGAELRAFAPHRISLESIFLSAVEAGAREEQQAGPHGEGA